MIVKPENFKAPSSDARSLAENVAEAQRAALDNSTRAHEPLPIETVTRHAAAATLGCGDAMQVTHSSPATAVWDLVSLRREWAVAAVTLALGLGAFGFIFRAEIAAAIYVWYNSYAYGHCFLVLPVAAYLAWDRRDAVAATVPQPQPWITVLAIPVAAAWFVADRLGIMEGRQLMAMALFQILVAALLGLRSWRSLSAPLLYLFFLVPFGYFVVPSLQDFVVRFATTGLDLLGIPVISNGTVIEIPEGSFQVEQACAGLRFLFAMAAFSVPYACLMYTSPLRRVLFIGVSLAVAIAGNCFRVLLTILLAHLTANAQLVEADHVLGGWVFYVLVGGVVAVIGMAFRQDRGAAVRANQEISYSTAGASVVALSVVVLLATAPQVAADYLDRLGAGAAAMPSNIAAPALTGCTTLTPPDEPRGTTAAGKPAPAISQMIKMITYRCDGDLFALTLRRYPPRIASRALFSSLRTAETPVDAEVVRETDGVRFGTDPKAPVWSVAESQKGGLYAVVATALWVNGRPSGSGMATRANQALNTLRPSPLPPMAVVVTHHGLGSPYVAWAAMGRFLAKAAPVAELVGKLASAPTLR
jgi:exosortase A